MRLKGLVVVICLGLAACGGGGSGDGPLIVATTTILGDVASNVAGEEATVEVLMPIGADPHDFEPSSRQAATLESADLVVANGLELEAGIDDLLDSVEENGVRVLRIGPLVEPLWLGDEVRLDPHVWLDPMRMAVAGELIAIELGGIEPTGGWADRAATYRLRLENLDAEIFEMSESLPQDRRLLVTQHAALQYFADRYGFGVLGVVVPGGSTVAEPSSAALAELIAAVRDAAVPAIFGEVGAPGHLLDAIAAEPGVEVVVVDLFVGSLGEPGTEADTYIGMMRTNARLITEALR